MGFSGWLKSKKKFKEYGHTVETFDLGSYGNVEYAHWLHPKVRRLTLTRDSVDFYKQFVGEGDVAIDIGAHAGDTTIPMAVATGSTGVTLALEPNPHAYKILEANAELNAENLRIIPLNFAATEKDGTYTFLYSNASFCNGGNLGELEDQGHNHACKLDVEGRNLLHYLESEHPELIDRIRYIKVDAEGYDRAILTTLIPLIRRNKPFITAEVLKRLTLREREDLFTLFEALGYDLFKQEDHGAGERITRDNLEKWQHFDVVAIPMAT